MEGETDKAVLTSGSTTQNIASSARGTESDWMSGEETVSEWNASVTGNDGMESEWNVMNVLTVIN